MIISIKTAFALHLGILGFSFLTQASAGDGALTQVDPTCTCNPKESDPYEKPHVFSFGKFKGQCVDSCRFRNVRIIFQNRKQPATIALANILHKKEYKKTTFNFENIHSLEIGREEFLPGIYHIFLRFTIKEGVPALQLVDQKNPDLPLEKTRALVLSAEGAPAKGHDYNLIESYFENYLIVTRILTEEEVYRRAGELKHPLMFTALKMTPQQAQEVFLKGVEHSNDTGFSETYKLFSNNCSTLALKYIDGIANHKSEKDKNSFLSGLEVIQESLPIYGPFGTIRSLQMRKLID